MLIRTLLFLILVLIAHPAFAAGEKLIWSPPPMHEPAEVTVRRSPQQPDQIEVIIRRAGQPPKTDLTPEKSLALVALKPNEDAVIKLPKDGPLRLGGLMVRYGGNIRMIGGHMIGLAPADQKLRAVLRFAGQSGTVFVEGVVIDANRQYGLDGILIGALNHRPKDVPDITLQNIVIKGTDSTTKGFHADAFQYYGATRTTRMDHVSITAQYQGLFLDPQHDIKAIDLRHVDLRYTDPATAAGFLFFLRVGEEANTRHPSVRLRDVYVGERTNRPVWENSVIFPHARMANGTRRQGDRATFPSFPEVDGFVTRGQPPGGPFVRESTVGVKYRSPGYEGDTR